MNSDKNKGHRHGDKHKEHHDHSNHHAMMIRDFRKRFWISLAATVPVLLLSPMIQGIFGYELSFSYSQYLLFALASFIFLYGGWPFLKGLYDELKDRKPGMMTLIAVAITVAYAYSTATTFGLEGKKFFWELATLIDIMLLGHWIEMKSVMGASRSLQELVKMIPSRAHLVKGDSIEDVDTDKLNPDDKVLIKPGEKIPVDGIIIKGESGVNESFITGESKPVSKKKDDKVVGGSINGNGSLTVKVEGVGEEAYLNKVINMVSEAQENKSKAQHIADKIASWLTLIALVVGFGTLATWLITGKTFAFALERMASVMVITCPHALGLAVPLVVAISTSVAAGKGLLIRNRTAFENSRHISLLVLDKTGTLTKGNFGVSRFKSVIDKYSDKDILRLAGALETKSEHPLAAGIMKKVKEEDIDVPDAENFNAIKGKGVEGSIEGDNVKIVSPGYVEDKDIDIPEDDSENKQETVVYVLVNDR
ncbi:MAG: heavy metal translocating P-type ATPase, partial [Bacteroidales bacterium]|nr:heavy metal translocating P-type ATPase [Bacteroidales bacterium]